MADFLLGIDSGGTAVKVAVIAADGTELAVRGTTHPALTPAPGHAERDPERTWECLARDIRLVLADAGLEGPDIAGIGVTGYGNGLWLLDEAGRPVGNGVLTSDLRAASICADWRRDPPDEATRQRRLQVAAWPGKPMPILAWLQRHVPDQLARARFAVSSKDYLRSRLVGTVAGEVSDQSSSGYSPVERRENDPAMLAAVGLSELARLMPPLLEPMDIAGEVTAEAAAATGLRAGTPVSAGCSDNLAVMLGTAAVTPDDVVVMAGTWGLHQCFLDALPADPSAIFLTHGLLPGTWLAIEGSPTSAGQLDWFVERFIRSQRPDLADGQLFAMLNEGVARLDPRDPPVFFLPYLNGAMDQSSARGSLIGLTNWHGLPHTVRGMMEGIAFEHRRHLDRLAALRGRPGSARFAGGAARSEPWREIFAAALDLELELPAGRELGALGAAILAAVALGRQPDLPTAVAAMTRLEGQVQPDPALTELLAGRYRIWRDLAVALAPHWDAVIDGTGTTR
ncbi:MAG TPA: FGGY-family carbohydrate kinase [Geminicoccus sp.]|uniref:FGGY-family carbohydrate kinase n=1 Tax=Geminicoccus sp. TaxID=2024832 RepID=UPI002C26CDA7|nr:FGGY-family carbohydrate kinase [Geminicoccus sp.]HWL72192.1 FGGY-family carbohydrate kinase [Geminicoccus sp.]